MEYVLKRNDPGARDIVWCLHLAAHALDVLQGELVGVAADLVQLLVPRGVLLAAAGKAPHAPAVRQLPLACLQLVRCMPAMLPQNHFTV